MTAAPLFIVSGPSGSGKSTLIGDVLPRFPGRLRLAVSVTTRPRREGEVDGRHYHFWTRERFEQGLKEDAFLEHAIVHGEHYYGTPRSEVDPYRDRGVGVVLDIDVQGAQQIRARYPEHVSVFVRLSRFEMYEERLVGRGTESREKIDKRLETARRELARVGEYQHVIINDDRAQAADELAALVATSLK
jgi:guanylate kinase